jgi:hypothetical protein
MNGRIDGFLGWLIADQFSLKKQFLPLVFNR